MPWFTSDNPDERNKALAERIKNAETDEELDEIQKELDDYTDTHVTRKGSQSYDVSAYDKLLKKR